MRLIPTLAAMALLAAAPAHAASVVQSGVFNVFHILNGEMTAATAYPPTVFMTGTDSRTVHFQGFDASLGTLKGATLTVSSVRDLSLGVLISALGGGSLDGDASAEVYLGGSKVAGTKTNLLAACGVGNTSGCLDFSSQKLPFDFAHSFSTLGAFQAPGGVDVDLLSNFDFELEALVLYGRLTGRVSQEWIGKVELAYEYDLPPPPTSPSPAPEPGTWALMILGFGLTGAALRRRHAGAVSAL